MAVKENEDAILERLLQGSEKQRRSENARAEEEQPIGTWGQRHLDYLKQCRRVTYANLFTSGRLNTYLADIDRQAQEHFIHT